MGIGMIALLVLTVVLIVYLVRAMTAQPSAHVPAQPAAQSPAAESPRDIVQRRYAGGEIDREEYLQKLTDL